MILYDSGHLPSRFVSARDVLKGTVPADKIEAHIVFIGTSAVGLQDLRATPIEEAMPGVEVHAQIVEQVLSQNMLAAAGLCRRRGVPLSGRDRAAVRPAAAAASGGADGARCGCLIGIAILVPWLAFDRGQLLFDPIYPPVTLAAIYISGSALSFMQTERERRQIRGAFSLYLSPDQVERRGAKSGGAAARRRAARDHRDVHRRARLHAHLRAVRSGRPDPFHEPLPHAHDRSDPGAPRHDRQVHGRRHHGLLERAAGRRAACRARLRGGARHAGELVTLNAEWKAEAEAEGRQHIPVNIGIGLNTGQATVGNFGSDAAADLFLPGRRGEPRLPPRRAVQDLWRRHRRRREHLPSRSPTSRPWSSTWSW